MEKATAIVIGSLIIALAIYFSGPNYQLETIDEKVNNGVGAWRINTNDGSVSICTGTDKGLFCSKEAAEAKDIQAQPVAKKESD